MTDGKKSHQFYLLARKVKKRENEQNKMANFHEKYTQKPKVGEITTFGFECRFCSFIDY
jgi:hypothetical protein